MRENKAEEAPDEAEVDEVEPAAFLDDSAVVEGCLRAEPEAEEAAASEPEALDDLAGMIGSPSLGSNAFATSIAFLGERASWVAAADTFRLR